MRSFQVSALIVASLLTVAYARPQQQQIDPAYLREYYSQLAARGSPTEATPIFEQEAAQPQYLSQIRASNPEQIRAQPRFQGQQPQFVAPTVRQYLQQPQQRPQEALQYQPPTYQQQNIQYNRPQVAKQAPPRRPAVQQPQYESSAQRFNKDDSDEPEYDSIPANYQFGFDVKDDEFTNYQNRKEVRDGNVIKGSYSVVDSDGFIRTVTYTADPKEGFKAEVVREPTDIVVKIPTPTPEGSLRHQQQQHHHSAQPQYAPQPTQYRPRHQQQQHAQQPQQFQYEQ